MLEQTASLKSAAWIDGGAILFDVLDDALLIDHKGRAIGESALLVEDAVILRYLSLKIAQQRKIQPFLLGKRRVGKLAVHTDAQDLSAGFLEFGDISLIRLQLLGSPSSEGQDIKSQHDTFLSLKFAQLHLVAALVR